MKMMESSIKWSMNRDEQRQVKHEKNSRCLAEIMNRRQQEAEEMKAQTAARTRASREKALVDSKDRQQFKREVKSVAHNEHLRQGEGVPLNSQGLWCLLREDCRLKYTWSSTKQWFKNTYMDIGTCK